jgi:hypothetical protein
MLSYFEYWHNIKLESIEQVHRYNEIAKKHGKDGGQIETLVQWHTTEDIGRRTGLKRHSINKAIATLVSLGFVTMVSPRMKMDTTRHFLFNPDVVNDWLQNSYNRIAENSDPSAENCIPEVEICATDAEICAPKVEICKHNKITTKTSSKISTEISTEQEAARAKNDRFAVFRECYNQHKPASFASLTVLNPARRKKLEQLAKDCGGVDNALVALANALRYANADDWYRGKDLSFDNFASNGKILQLHERWVERTITGTQLPPELNTQANRDTITEAERLLKILEKKYGKD